jgi:hypothetical protein
LQTSPNINLTKDAAGWKLNPSLGFGIGRSMGKVDLALEVNQLDLVDDTLLANGSAVLALKAKIPAWAGKNVAVSLNRRLTGETWLQVGLDFGRLFTL